MEVAPIAGGDPIAVAPRRRVLVTGGTGLVGRGIQEWIASNPEAKDHEEYVFLGSKDGDLRSMAETKALFDKHRPTHVIHLAARVGGLFSNMKHKVEFYRDNILINDNVMECCRRHGVAKLVSALSTCIFPDKVAPEEYPLHEGMVHNGPPHRSNEGYAYAKRMIDILNRCYREEYGCKFTSVIPTNVYGKHDNFSLEHGHVVPGLMHRCLLAKKEREDFRVAGSGAPLRQFIYNVDLGALLVWAMRSYDSPEPIILSVGEDEEVSIGDVARMVAAALGFRGNIVFDTSKADGQFKKTASNKKLQQLRPDFKFTPMKQGIHEVAKWFTSNYSIVRK